MNPLILIGIFAVATIIGYLIIRKVPSLLHTPLMSGMNALSGITILGALVTVSLMSAETNPIVGGIVGGIAVILAIINVVGGFKVTDRMLKLFSKKNNKGDK